MWKKNGSVELIGGKWEKPLAYGGRKRIKEKEKGKEIIMRRYFLGREDENNGSGGFPGFSYRCGNLSGKIQESSEIQVSRNDPK